MTLTIADDFRLKLPGGGYFSGQEAGFIVVESKGLAKKGINEPPLQMHLHCHFMERVVQREHGKCLWVVDSPSNLGLALLKQRFSAHQMVGLSIAGYFDPEPNMISSFWNGFAEVWKVEPWNNELPWTLAGVSKVLPDPLPPRSRFRSSTWSLEYVLRNHEKVNSFFVQMGWSALFGIRESRYAKEIVLEEFPCLGRL